MTPMESKNLALALKLARINTRLITKDDVMRIMKYVRQMKGVGVTRWQEMCRKMLHYCEVREELNRAIVENER